MGTKPIGMEGSLRFPHTGLKLYERLFQGRPHLYLNIFLIITSIYEYLLKFIKLTKSLEFVNILHFKANTLYVE